MKYDNKKVRYFIKDVETKTPIDFDEENTQDIINRMYDENGIELSKLEKELIKQLKKRNI